MTPIDEIKSRLDVVEVVGSYIRLKKAGKDYKAFCPFHKEKNPSFYVSPSKQIWHCFSCNAGGDIFSFVEKIEGVEFSDALRTLAKKAGVVLKREDPQLHSQRNILYQICEEATEFFQKELQKNISTQDYLKDRGLKKETISDFKIGFAPDSWNLLYGHLTELGFKEKDIELAGLIVKKEKSTGEKRNYYDRFRSRIMFPLCDLNGQVLGFTGRIFSAPQGQDIAKGGGEIAKYVNTPETLIYNKSRVIYGLDKAKVDIRKKDNCVIVEGQMDLIMAHQAGTKNTVATSGTALTSEHLEILKRYTENIVFCFDSDTGGENATKRAISMAQQFEFNIKIALLSKGKKDPAEIIKENPEQWEKILEKVKPIMDFYFENTISKYPEHLNVEQKREVAKELLYPIKNLANAIEQSHWIQILASKLKVEEKVLIETLKKIKARETGDEDFIAPKTIKSDRVKDLEERLLGVAIKHKQLDYLFENIKEGHLKNPEIKKLFNVLKNKKELSKEENYLKDYLIFKAEYCELEDKHILPEINCCIKEIKAYNIKEEMKKMTLDIKEAEHKSKKDDLKKLKEKFSKLTEELSELN